MVTIKIGKNEEGQRLDRFLKKYLNKASLSTIYKLIRKDVKINGKRAKESSTLAEGDELTLYISDETMAGLRKAKDHARAKRQFRIAYEDEDILIRRSRLACSRTVTIQKRKIIWQIRSWII